MMSRLTDKDRQTINNYLQHLVYKCIQCIVQSRRGSKQHTSSKAAIADWFNLTIKDLPDIQSEAKSTFGVEGKAGLKEPVCVAVSLVTNENETIRLEYWWLVNCEDSSRAEIKSTSSVYMYCETLLKSLLAMSRATPAYQLARKQGGSTSGYQLHCRLESGEPMLSSADDYQKHVIGRVPSLSGTVKLYVAYKMNLHIGPRQIASPRPVEMRDNYYESLPSHGAAAEAGDRHDGPVGAARGDHARIRRPAFASNLHDDIPHIDDVEDDDDPPFASLLQPVRSNQDKTESTPSCVAEKSENVEEIPESAGTAIPQDFVMLELKAPFAGREEDLGRFYRECQAAPTLTMFDEVASVQEMLGKDSVVSIAEQLAKFEANAEEFTEFVNSLQEVDT